ncbi:hypothetical protein XFF6990_390192 [Xanthomonas citri pv. fuscans]|nr:hypothetical protein XFF6990_390192 [Xanthomonas citri pv. fuscans]
MAGAGITRPLRCRARRPHPQDDWSRRVVGALDRRARAAACRRATMLSGEAHRAQALRLGAVRRVEGRLDSQPEFNLQARCPSRACRQTHVRVSPHIARPAR